MHPAPFQLDQPLPAEVAGIDHTWLFRYRRYPVFSRPWVRGRLRSWGLLTALALLAMVVSALLSEPDERPWGGIVQLTMMTVFPLVAGPLLGAWVRRQGWSVRREGWALVTAMALVLGSMWLIIEVAAEPTKQFIAERAGAVDAQGKRKRVLMSFGITISNLDHPPRTPDIDSSDVRIANLFSGGLATLWLAGGLAVWGWRRERLALAALAQAQELAHAQAQRREAELRLSVLAAQVEPHFLFNTLAGVRSAISSDPARASVMIDRLVDYLRAAIPRLRSDGGSQSTLGGQVEIVRAYLGLMAARMPRLCYSIDVPADLLDEPFPPLMLISLAENAIKHGVEPKVGPALIELRARRTEAGALEVTVSDDGAGFGASAAGGGLGLSNIRERLQQLYQGRAALTLKARAEGGVTASVCLPAE